MTRTKGMRKAEVDGRSYFVLYATSADDYERTGHARMAELVRKSGGVKFVGLSKTRTARTVLMATEYADGRMRLACGEGA